jgi:hypothetical protein
MPDQPRPTSQLKPKVFIDADVLFAGSAAPSEHGASLVLLRMAEITLLDARTSQQVITEVERNLAAKLPQAIPAMRLIVSRCLEIVPDPVPHTIQLYRGLAHHADLPILVAALETGCSWLLTFNTRHYSPGHPDVDVLTPGDFLLRVRDLLARLR